MFGVGREVEALVLEVIRFEGYGAAIEIGIVHQHPPAIYEHGICLVGMSLHKPFRHVSGYLYTIQDSLYAQRCLIQNLRSAVNSLLTHGFTSLIE